MKKGEYDKIMSGNVTENVFTIFRERFEKFTKKNEKNSRQERKIWLR